MSNPNPVITCIGPNGQPTTFPADTISNSGGVQATNPNFGAQRLNLTMMDVQNTIQEGRAAGIKLFSLGLGPTSTQYYIPPGVR